uniref:PORR domain-containing protein n=1 Tax=Chenopodium quinoa TaxID=63459 RepID=A0A803M565_CHEQI
CGKVVEEAWSGVPNEDMATRLTRCAGSLASWAAQTFDRGLDHAVEKEKDLKYVVNLKNLLKSEPSKSLPLSSIVDHTEKLSIPCRTIDFIRKYPNFFEEYFPANIGVHPHVRLTPESLNLDAEEQLMYDSDTFRKDAADRLLKLLMLCRINEFPLKLIDRFKWDLGLPDNYVDTLVPEFPDYFKVKRVNQNQTRPNRVEGLLELVCWSDELAVSAIEKMAKKGDPKYEKGMPIAFPLQFSNGLEMDKSLKRWLDDWQKLPYVSPYENATHLQPNTDMSDKWVVAVLHELFHILVTKKTERDNMLRLGEFLGIKPRLKRALAHHPGIFYRSSKIGTHTVVLRDGFKRGLLIDKHPLIDMRNKYIHLMHKVKEGKKSKSVASPNAGKQQAVKEGEEENEKETEEDMQLFGSDVDESSCDEEDKERHVEEQVESSRDKVNEGRRKPGEGRGKPGRNALEEESDSDDDEKQIESAGDGRNNGRRGSGKVNEGKGKPGEGRGRRWRNVSWDESGDAREENQVRSSRGGRSNGRRGSGRANEGRRDSEEGRGKPWKKASHNESGGDDEEEQVESSRGGHYNGRRGSGVSSRGGRSNGKRGFGEGRPWSKASRGESGNGGGYNEERVESSRGGRSNVRRGSSGGRPWSNASRGESGSGGSYNKERGESSRGGRSNGRRGSGGGRPGRNSSRERLA